MEIRNNTPSFGMAFKKPSAEQMEAFTNYVTKGRKPKFVEKGIRQVVAEQAGNKHFDIEYHGGDCFSVNAKTEKAESMFGDTIITSENSTSKSVLEQVEEKSQNFIRTAEGTSGLKQFFLGVKAVYTQLKATVSIIRSPKEILPNALRDAAETATRFEKRVDAQIAKEALISGAFESKVKATK